MGLFNNDNNDENVYPLLMAVQMHLKNPNSVLRLCDADKNISGTRTWMNDLGKAYALMSKQNFDEAILCLKRVEAHAQICTSEVCLSQFARLSIPFLEIERGNYREAITLYEDLINDDPEEIMAYYCRLLAFFQLAAKGDDSDELQRILASAKEDFKRFKGLVDQIPDGKLYPIRVYRKLVVLEPEGLQGGLERLNNGVLVEQITRHEDNDNDNMPVVDYLSPGEVLMSAEVLMGGIEGFAIAIATSTPGAAVASVLESDAGVAYRASCLIFFAGATIDAAERETDPMQKRQRLRTAEIWLDKLDELDENLPAEIVEQETLTREILQEALALATEDL